MAESSPALSTSSPKALVRYILPDFEPGLVCRNLVQCEGIAPIDEYVDSVLTGLLGSDIGDLGHWRISLRKLQAADCLGVGGSSS